MKSTLEIGRLTQHADVVMDLPNELEACSVMARMMRIFCQHVLGEDPDQYDNNTFWERLSYLCDLMPTHKGNLGRALTHLTHGMINAATAWLGDGASYDRFNAEQSGMLYHVSHSVWEVENPCMTLTELAVALHIYRRHRTLWEQMRDCEAALKFGFEMSPPDLRRVGEDMLCAIMDVFAAMDHYTLHAGNPC